MSKKETAAAQEKVSARGVGAYISQDVAQDFHYDTEKKAAQDTTQRRSARGDETRITAHGTAQYITQHAAQ